ncbi:uncharacterized protein LOC126176049 [Schistocerca cancellata]|uniref:uncharacterized protein LOC126176049 n=1 Tax=Schistocerca cancellata TaxID=274614 RepID=UPI002117910C|nr:uncharacterized protein LOC126176049 [Schistocerca cancellata]
MRHSVRYVSVLTVVLLLKSANNSPIPAFNASEVDAAENEVVDVPCLFGRLNSDESFGSSDGLMGRSLEENSSPVFRDRTTVSTTERGASNDDAEETSVARETRGYMRRASKVIAPLVLGFVLASVVMGGVTAVKLFLVKALLLSQLALGAALLLAAKSLLSAVGGGGYPSHQPYLQHLQHLQPIHPPLVEPSPYHHNPYAAEHHFAPSMEGYPDYGYHAVGRSPEAVPVEQEDLQAHYSNQVAATAPAAAGARNATSRMDVRPVPTGGITLVKSQSHHAPVVVYRKVVSTGRAAAS